MKVCLMKKVRNDMKNFYRLICLAILVIIVACCFAGCKNNEDPMIDTCFNNVATTSTSTTNNTRNNTTPVSTRSTNIGSTNKVVTNYSKCWILRVDGGYLHGTVVSWMIVNENLIQVTLKNITFSSGITESGPRTYLVSVDRVYFCTD